MNKPKINLHMSKQRNIELIDQQNIEMYILSFSVWQERQRK